MNKKNKKNSSSGKEKKQKEEREIVYVDIHDVLEWAKKEILYSYGGIGIDDVKYDDNVEKLKFTIPKKNREGKCSEILTPEPCGDDEGGCGETGGSCICGKKEDHEGDHECELCGELW